MKRHLPILLALIAMVCAVGAKSPTTDGAPTPYGKCPDSPNACNNDDGCDILGYGHNYTKWKHLYQCTWGTSGCVNDKTKVCYEVERWLGISCTGTLDRTDSSNEDACK